MRGVWRMPTLLIGTYTTDTASQGVYRIDLVNNRLGNAVCVAQASDPSYLMMQGGDALFWVQENLPLPNGELVCAAPSGEGYAIRWRVSTQGRHPCHLAASPEGAWLAVANYTSGSVALYPNNTGNTPILCALFPGLRGGLHPTRQTGPHAHFVRFVSARELWSCDLGADSVRRFVLWQGQWRESTPALELPAGCGPRHLLIVGQFVYVLCELSGELMTFALPGDDLTTGVLLSRQPCVDPLTEGTAAAMKLGPEGLMYVTHRGSDSIGVFSLANPARPELFVTVPCGGQDPRDLLALPGMLICACQGSDSITVLTHAGGQHFQLRQTFSMPCPVCLIEESRS